MSNADMEALRHPLGSSARKWQTSSLAPQPQYREGRQEGREAGRVEERERGKEK